MKHPGWCNPQMCTAVLSHTQLTIFEMSVIWHPVLTSSVGHYQENECIEKQSAYHGVGDLVIGIFIYNNFVNVLGPIATDCTCTHCTVILNVFLT